tara:strand:+ start:173 stop:640 length:468 start_codon:yes stop_codon:yes gene_type:complete
MKVVPARKRFDPPKYYDLEGGNFTGKWVVEKGGIDPKDNSELKHLCAERERISLDMKEMEVARKNIDADIQVILHGMDADGVIIDVRTTLDRIYNGGRRSIDKNYLRKVLTPPQLARVYKTGQPYHYIQLNSEADKIVGELRGETVGELLVKEST